MKLAYTRFLNLIKAVRETTPEWPILDPSEDYLLDQLILSWDGPNPVPVLDANKLVPFLSSGTVQTKLANLVKKGVVELHPDPGDRRVKHVKPTKLTSDYFSKIESELKK